MISEKNGEEIHIRGCDKEHRNILKEDGCVKMKNEDNKDEDDIDVHICWCSTNLCNSAQRIGIGSIFGGVTVLVLLIFQ